jgi:peptide/nickel transport system substrate-binding protein
VAVLAVGVAAACAVAGCGSGGSADTGGTGSGGSGGSGASGGSGGSGIVRFAVAEVNSFDPRVNTPTAEVALEPVYDTLIGRSPDGKIGPELATKWEFSADKKAMTLTLRDEVTFQDGAPFNAEAVKANLLAFQKGGIRANQLKAISSIEVVDELHVRLNLATPATSLISVLAGENGMMVSPKALTSKDLATHPVGAGPYQLVKTTASTYQFRPWAGYWAADTVKNKGLDFSITNDTTAQLRGLKAGQLDIMKLAANQISDAKSSGLAVTLAQTGDIEQVVMNVSRPPFDKPDVRRAVSLAFDRDAISKAVFSGTCAPSAQPFGVGLPGHSETLAKLPGNGFDPDKAKQLIEKAGAKGKQVTLMVNTSPEVQQLATVVQSELGEVGLKVKIEALDPVASLAKVRSGDYDFTVSAITAERPGPANYSRAHYQKNGPANKGNWNMPTVDRLLAQAQTIADQAARSKIYAQVAEAVYDAGSPAAPICNPSYAFAATKNVSGVQAPKLSDFDWPAVQVG